MASVVDANGNVWLSWISDTSVFANQTTGGTTGGTSMSAQVWTNWTATAATTASVSLYAAIPPSAGQVKAYEERMRDREKRLKLAAERAAALLQTVLDDEQKEELKKQGYFHVHTRNGKRVYRLRPGYNPVRIKGEDGKQYSYCIHPHQTFPRDDAVAALKLLLDSDEGAFLKIANRSLTQVAA